MARPPFSQGVGPGEGATDNTPHELLIFPAPGDPDTIVIRCVKFDIIAPTGEDVICFVTPTSDPTVLPFTLSRLVATTTEATSTEDMRFVMPAISHLWFMGEGAGSGIAKCAVMYYRLTPT